MEKRVLPVEESEIRVEGENGERKITGYAAIFNRRSENLGGFVEIIRPGAFRKAVEGADVRALFNHDPNYVLGRTTNGSLTLEENQKGLKFTATPPDTQWADDLLKSIERGDVSQCSFSFRVAENGDKWTEEKGAVTRELLELEYLGDVGPVTFPAYPQTSIQARSILQEAGFDFDALTSVVARAQRGLALTGSDRDLINASIMLLQDLLPAEESDGGDHDTREDGDHERLQNILAELELVEAKHHRRGEK